MRSSGQNPFLLLGVDGGGTKTSAWITSVANPLRSLHALSSHPKEWIAPPDQVVGKGTAGPGNPRSVGFESACENIEAAVEGAVQDFQSRFGSPITKRHLAAACVGLAGAGRREEQQAISERLREKGLSASLRVTDDIEPIRWAAEWEALCRNSESIALDETQEERDSRPWVTLIAGTGSIARCELEDDSGNQQILRSGGWGYLLGDEGSGFSIGLGALQHACKEVDSGVPPSALSNALLSRLGLESVSSLVGWVYQSPIPRKQIADLAPLVIEARHREAFADALIRKAIEGWSELVAQVANRSGVRDSYSLAIAGGIPNHCPELVKELEERLREVQAAPASIHVVRDPVVGCLALARRLWTR